MALKALPPDQQETVLLRKAGMLLRAINHPLRQQMLFLMHKSERLSVKALYSQLKLSQSITSQHLGILRRTGFVLTVRKGKQVFYMVNYQKLKEVQQLASLLL